MPKVSTKPDDRTKTVYVTATDRRTRKSKHLTIYGLTPTQAIEAIRKAIDQMESTEEDGNRDQAA